MEIGHALLYAQNTERMLEHIGEEGRFRVFNALMREMCGGESERKRPDGKPDTTHETYYQALKSLIRYVEASGSSLPRS